MKKLFDKSDLVPDSERKDMLVYNNETLMKKYPVLKQLSEPVAGDFLSYEALEDIFLNHNIDVSILSGDFYSTQDAVPYGIIDRR